MRAVRIALVALALAVAMTGVAVAKAPAPGPLVGTWKLVAMITPAGPVPPEKMQEGTMTWRFDADGTFVGTVTRGAQSGQSVGTWSAMGNLVTIVEKSRPDGMKWNYVVKDLLTMVNPQGSVTMRFQRVK